MIVLNQVNGRAGFDHDQNLRRRVGGREIKDGLLSAGVEDPEIFLLQAADEFATLVEDRSVELHDFSGDLQWMFRGRSRRLLSPSRGVSCVQTGAGEK